MYELNGKELCGERVIIEHARGPRRDRDFYGGGYGGGGRSKYSLLQNLLSLSFRVKGRPTDLTGIMASKNVKVCCVGTLVEPVFLCLSM